MSEIIVDTSALIAFFVKSERNHGAARQFYQQNQDASWIILESVFDETVTWFRSKISAGASIQIGRVLRQEHRYVNLTDDDDRAIWETFCRYDDQLWSYTDCSILVMAQRLRVFEVFSFDVHIRQMAGLGIMCVPSLGYI
jgi:uncharacterized protein